MYKRREIEDMRESLEEIIQKGKRQERRASWKGKVLPWLIGGAIVGSLALGGIYIGSRIAHSQPPVVVYLTEETGQTTEPSQAAGIVETIEPTQTMSFPTPTYEPTATTIPPTPTSIPPTPTEESYDFCSNLEVSIQGFRVREQLPELRDSIYAKIKSEYGNSSTEYTLLNVMISAKEDLVKAEILHDPFGGNPGVPEVYDLGYTKSEIADFIAMTGGPKSDSVVLGAEAASIASPYITDLLAKADEIVAHRGNKTLTVRELSDLLQGFSGMIESYTPLYITPLGEWYAITLGDNYDILVDRQTGLSILKGMGMANNCSY